MTDGTHPPTFEFAEADIAKIRATMLLCPEERKDSWLRKIQEAVNIYLQSPGVRPGRPGEKCIQPNEIRTEFKALAEALRKTGRLPPEPFDHRNRMLRSIAMLSLADVADDATALQIKIARTLKDFGEADAGKPESGPLKRLGHALSARWKEHTGKSPACSKAESKAGAQGGYGKHFDAVRRAIPKQHRPKPNFARNSRKQWESLYSQ